MQHKSRMALLVALAAVVPATLAAQMAIGIKGGGSFATLSNSSPDWKSRTGFVAGLAFNFGGGFFSLQPEALYVQEGAEFNGTPASGSGAPHLSYLSVPLLFKVTLPTPALSPIAYAGPSVNFRLTCSFQGTDCKDMTRSTDYGAVLGAGIRFGGASAFTLEGRYIWGLKDINDPGAGVDNKTRTFVLLAGISM